MRVEAFVCRKPDENHEGVYRFLLKRNRRLYGVAYTLDNVGDIYLVGRMALARSPPMRSTGCSARCSRPSTPTSNVAGVGFSLVHPEGVGVAGIARANR